MITVNKANPTPGEITSSLTGSTGDGAGLHFENNGYINLGDVTAAKFGTGDFSIEFVLNQTAENSSDNYIYFTNLSGKNRAYFRNDLVENQFRITFSNSSNSETSVDIAYDMSADYNKPTHYVVTFDRDGLATLYKNGASVGSVNISAFSAINLGDDTTQPQRLGSGTGFGVLGTFYRFRTFNTVVDAKALFERADVPRTLTSNLKIDLDLAFANPSQSLTVQDRNGIADGTASSSTLVTQVQPVVQLNATAARIGTSTLQPADGELVVDKIDVRNGNVRVIGGNQLEALNAANNTNVDIINSGGDNVAQLGLRVAQSEKVTITSGGNITTNSDGIALKLDGTSATTRGIFIRNTGGSAHGYLHTDGHLKIIAEDSGKSINFYTADDGTGTARLSIASTGVATFNNGIAQGGTSGNEEANIDTSGVLRIRRDSGAVRDNVTFTNGGTAVGSITSSTSATQYNTSSDYRLKENLTPLTGALDRIDALPVYRFNFTADPDTTVDGFVAHEVSAHVPEAITGEKDAMKTVVVQEAVEAVEAQPATYWQEGDELPEGVAVGDEKTPAVEAVEAVEEVTEEQPDYQGIDQSKLVPLLVAAVKELKAKVETLENA